MSVKVKRIDRAKGTVTLSRPLTKRERLIVGIDAAGSISEITVRTVNSRNDSRNSRKG